MVEDPGVESGDAGPHVMPGWLWGVWRWGLHRTKSDRGLQCAAVTRLVLRTLINLEKHSSPDQTGIQNPLSGHQAPGKSKSGGLGVRSRFQFLASTPADADVTHLQGNGRASAVWPDRASIQGTAATEGCFCFCFYNLLIENNYNHKNNIQCNEYPPRNEIQT